MKPKRVLEAAGLSRAHLHDLVEHGDVALAPVKTLLAAMQHASRPVKPAALGVLGESHVRRYLTTHSHVEPESLKYRKLEGVAEGLPFVLEVACGWYTRAHLDDQQRTIIGINWTPALKAPFPELPELLGKARVDDFDPVVVLVHLAMPRPDFTDRGKGALTLSEAVREALAKGIATVTKHWTAFKRQADRDDRVREREREHYLKAQRRQFLSIKEAAYQVMEAAYWHAAGDQGLANDRQVMYAARPHVLQLTGGRCWKDSDYFTQELLPRFMVEHPALTADWDVVFDDRGHFIEPHTEHRIGLGTLPVRNYIRQWHAHIPSALSDLEVTALDHNCPTRGPAHRYRFALFIEKEGFDPLLEAAQMAAHFDMAIFSTKGQSVIAARKLVDELSQRGVTILVCHDFDKSGLEILDKLRTDTWRYRFAAPPRVIDLGLRLADVQAMNLQSEPVSYPSGVDPRHNLRACGATEEECQFLVRRDAGGGWGGQRVELNAMTSDQFIVWLVRKLAEAGVQKVVPDQVILAKAYRRAVWQKRIEAAIEEALSYIDEDEDIPIPDDLEARIRAKLDSSAKAWDQVLWDLVTEEDADS